MLRGVRRERIGWYFYDWANSAFATTVVTVFLGPYLTSIAKAAADVDGFIHPLGLKIHAGSFYPYLVSVSVLLQALLLPLLGAIADYSHRKKQMLGLFAYIGAVSTTGLYFLHGTNYLFGGALFILANVSFGASIVIYNAFLPELAAPEERDDVSSKGWALGYLGGGLLLGLNLAFFSQADSLGLTIEDAVRISLASAGIWWALFTIIPLATLRSRQPIKNPPRQGNYLALGFKQLRRTLAKASQYPQTFLFLLAYLLYNDGIQTVIAMASEFGQEELGLSMSTLTTVILMVQFVAFFGALLFNYTAKIVGTKRAIEISLLGWIGVVIYAYGFLQTAFGFYVVGFVIALVMGGSQALSRSMYSLMIPRGQEAEYFSLYEISDRGTSWLGPFLFGLTLQLSNSYRQAILSLVVFFILGYVLLIRVNVREAAAKARHESPVEV